ncbi:ethanolamine utilization protein [Tepidibacter hydrothermalis]|uniref:Ethanolamine utilization protein n=1 Tax=Tepidibacter hydrothermalis TaxID=3036126 RepID=A0ABY8EIG3_9FIRM|nr:ethanolamine utilization protein [Tepidibacter hydrothermalis]WFD11755.1 ethanolamine utilization protein [Tepidibacter hydrothermalis]
MKFITEEDLRNLLKKEPFTIYKIKVGERLTPGARQFLLDRGIKIFDDGSYIKKGTENIEKESKAIEIRNNWKKKMFDCKMKSMEALFLITAEELLSRDVFLAQRVIDLGKQFSSIKKALDAKNTSETFCFKECTGIKADNFSDDLDDCFEITEFHIQLEKGREIVILHRLRCALRELEPFILELFENNDSENKICKDIIGKVNQSINTLSQIICSIFGGKRCQRKN